MIGIDTNVLVRYLVEDDKRQTERVHRFLTRCRQERETVWVSAVVLCEVAWVLESVYGRSKADIIQVFEQLQTVRLFQLEDEDAVRAALVLAKQNSGDVVGNIIGQVNLAAGCTHSVTFDKKLRHTAGFASV